MPPSCRSLHLLRHGAPAAPIDGKVQFQRLDAGKLRLGLKIGHDKPNRDEGHLVMRIRDMDRQGARFSESEAK
jgi:hypothetical protein